MARAPELPDDSLVPGNAHAHRDGPRSRRWRALLVCGAILFPQVLLYRASLLEGKIALPVNLTCELAARRGGADSSVDVNYALWDPIWYYEPMRQFMARELRAGRMPLWNPEIFCGVPTFRGIWSPFQWVYFLWPDPRTLVWIWLAKSLVAGSGTYLFLRRAAQVGFWPAVFGATAYPLTGFFVLWMYYGVTSACAWLPWLLLFTESTVRRPSGFGPVGVALVTAAVVFVGVGGPGPQLLLASVLYGLWRLISQYRRHVWRSPDAWKSAGALAGAWGIGIVMTAPQSLPAAEYLRTTHRVAARAHGLIELPKAGWRTAVEVLLPYHYGDTTRKSLYIPQTGNRLEGVPSAYAGLVMSLVLAPWAFCDPRRRSLCWFWCSLGAFGLAWHADVPLLSEIFYHFPFNLLRNNRFSLYTGWAIVTLATCGLEVLMSTRCVWRRWFWGPVVIILLTGVFVSVDLVEVPDELKRMRRPVQADWFQRTFVGELATCGVAAIAWLLPFRRSRKAAFVFLPVCGLALGELVFNAWNVNPQGDRKCYYPRTPCFDELQQAPWGRVCLGRAFSPNMNMMYRLPEIRGYDGADPLRLIRLFRAADPGWSLVIPHAVTQSFDPPRSPMLDMLGLRYVAHSGLPPDGHSVFAVDRFCWIEARAGAMPRAYIPRRVEPVKNDVDCLRKLADPTFDPREVAYVDGPVEATSASQSPGTAEIVEQHSSRVLIAAQMRSPGWLVLADAWAPGWRAFVNGREVPVRRTNYLLRGVELPAEECTIEFRYEPASFTWGVRTGLAALGALGLWCLMIARRPSGAMPD